MDEHDKRILWSSAESVYRTPKKLFKRLNQEFGFEFDAAADPGSALCEVWAGPGAPSEGYQDALDSDLPWWRCGVTWVNPPYSVKEYKELRKQGLAADHPQVRATKIENWVARCAREGQKTTVVAIVPASIQTQWWLEFVWGYESDANQAKAPRASEIRFIPHRVSFLDKDGGKTGSAGVNHAIVIWKPDPGYVGVWQPTVRYWDYL